MNPKQVAVAAVLCLSASAVACKGVSDWLTAADVEGTTQTTPTISASPSAAALSLTGGLCSPAGSTCTVFRNITITSSTSWTSSTPGFGSLPEGWTVSPDVGPIGSTQVAITYRYVVAIPSNGFIRFRTSGPNSTGVYVEVPVTLTVK